MQQEFTQSNFTTNLQTFISKLHKQLPKKTNLFYSPNNILTCMGMIYAGAQENTKQEIKQAVFPKLTDEEVHTEFEKAAQSLANQNTVSLTQSNRIWPEKSYQFLPEYVKVLEQHYKITVEGLDFQGNPEPSRVQINEWVAKQTNDKIKDLLAEGTITPLTKLVLTTAIHFKGDWKSKFNKKATKKVDFTDSSNKKVPVDMMTVKDVEFPYFEDQKFRAVELPYKGDQFSMGFISPNYNLGETLDTLKNHFFTEQNAFKELLGCIKNNEEKITVGVPKFKYQFKTSLKESLEKLGVKDAFSSAANFGGMDGQPGNLYLSDVIHQAFIEVNEDGAEAAAATAGMMMMRMLPMELPPFILDRPFLFYIKECSSDNILFFGEYTQPQ